MVPPVPGTSERPTKPTKRNMWNHVRVTAVASREKPQYHDVAPTLHDLRWQLTQANLVAETAWVLQALRQHIKTTRPRAEHTGMQAVPKRPCPPGRRMRGPSWRQYLNTTLTLQTPSTVIKTCLLLTTTADILPQSSWNSTLTLMIAHVERHLAQWCALAKEVTHRFFIESVRNLQESAWAV